MFKRILTGCLLFLSLVSTTFAGVYVGLGLGYTNVWSSNVTNVDTIRFEGVEPRLILGLGGLVSEHIYLAAELFGLHSVYLHNDTQGLPSSTYSLQTTWSAGASLMPGYYFDDVLMAYARLGIVDTRFSDLNVWKTGVQGGVGVDYLITPCWSARFEYVYTRYSSVSVLGNPNGGSFILSFLYRFPS